MPFGFVPQLVMLFAVPPSSSWQPPLSCQATSFITSPFHPLPSASLQSTGSTSSAFISVACQSTGCPLFCSPAGRLGLRGCHSFCKKNKNSASPLCIQHRSHPCLSRHSRAPTQGSTRRTAR